MHKWLFSLTLATLVLGQYAALSKSLGTNFYLFDIAVSLYGLFYVGYFLINDKKFIISKFFYFLFGFLFWAFITFLIRIPSYSTEKNLEALFYLLRLGSYFISGIVVYNLIYSNRLTRQFIIQALVLSGIFVAILGFLQLWLIPDFEQLDPLLGWDPHKNRLASTFFDPNFTGAYLVLCLMLGVFTLFKGKTVFSFEKNKLVSCIALVIPLIAVILTFSRSSWLMLAASVFIYGLFKNRKLLLLAILVMFLAYYAVPRIQTRISGTTDPADSAAFRLISWKNTTQIINDNLYMGVGYNYLREAQKSYGFIDYDTLYTHSSAGSDSSILFVTATTGLVGLGIFIYALYIGSISSLESAVLLLSLVIESQFINSLFYPQILFVWILLPALFSSVNYSTSRN